MLLRHDDEAILQFHTFVGRLVRLHIEVSEHIRESEVQFCVCEIEADAGPRPAREGDQSTNTGDWKPSTSGNSKPLSANI